MIYKFFLLCTTLLWTLNCQETFSQSTTEVPIPERNPLSYSWTIYTKNYPGKYKNLTREEAIQKSQSLNRRGLELKKKKKDTEAIKLYEEAIDHYAFGELLYNYGNSLSNIPRLEDSIEAYKIAEKLGFKSPELIQYNIACSYSRLNKVEKAYQYLALAVDRGYNAFKFIQKDPDMANLRKQPEWEEKIQSLVPKSVKLSKKDFYGKLVYPTPRLPIDYFLCSTGVIIQYSMCEKGFFRGKWSYENGEIFATYEEDCREVPKGKMVMASGACEQYERYKYEGCKKADSDFGKKEVLIGKSDLIYMKGIMKPESDYEYVPQLTPSSKEPKACNPQFIPKTSAELDL